MPEHQLIRKDHPDKTQQAKIQKQDQPVHTDTGLRNPVSILMLQRTIGNAAVQRLLAGRFSPPKANASQRLPFSQTTLNILGKSLIQRTIMSLKEWQGLAVLENKDEVPELIESVDIKLDLYHESKGDPNRQFGKNQLTNLSVAAKALSSTDGYEKYQNAAETLLAQIPSEMEEVEAMIALKARLQTTYGISIDNDKGVEAITKILGDLGDDLDARNALKNLKPSAWTLKQLKTVEIVLRHFSPLLNKSSQKLKSFSRINKGIEKETLRATSGKYASTLTPADGDSKHIALYDSSVSAVTDFAKDKAKPTQDETDQGFRGTIIHELSHALLEPLAPPEGETPNNLEEPITNMIGFFAYSMAYWKDISTKSDTSGSAEAPVTEYGKESAKEDLAEAVMYYFEEPSHLKAHCPERYAFIATYINKHLNEQSIEAIEKKVASKDPAELGGVVAGNLDAGSAGVNEEDLDSELAAVNAELAALGVNDTEEPEPDPSDFDEPEREPDPSDFDEPDPELLTANQGTQEQTS